MLTVVFDYRQKKQTRHGEEASRKVRKGLVATSHRCHGKTGVQEPDC